MGIRKELEGSFDYEIVDEFLDHYGMMLEVVDTLVLDLEKPEHYERCVGELFRIVHNIKSATGFLKLERINKLTAFVEDILEQMRRRDHTANDETISWLLLFCDQLKLWQNDFVMDNELSPINFNIFNVPEID